MLRVGGGQSDASQQFTFFGFVRQQDAGFQELFALIDAKVAELLLWAVALQAAATEDRIHIAAEADGGIVLRRAGVRDLKRRQQQAGEQQSDHDAVTDSGCG